MTMLEPVDLSAFHRGDPDLFERLVASLSPRLAATIRPLVTGPDDVLDVVQEAWQRAFARRTEFRGDGSLAGWLLTIARHVALAKTRQPSARLAHVVADDTLASAEAGGEPERFALNRALVAAVADLPPRERDTLICRLVMGYSTRETATRIGCAEGTVKAALSHAMAKLRPRLQDWMP